jgi:peptidoglycan/LPS O-acetylase OafA/YrhL
LIVTPVVPSKVKTVVQAGRNAGRIPELDGVRGVAMMLIIVWHYFAVTVRVQPGSLAAYGMKMFSLTWAGVDLFFVLSGFLIGGILLDKRTAPNYLRAFYARRFCRIFPLYYLMLGLFAVGVAARWASRGGGFTWLFGEPLPIWSYATYLQNFSMVRSAGMGPNWMGMSWSLAVEEQFYLVLPFVIRLAPARALPWLFAILAASAPVIRVALYATLPSKGFPGYVLLPGRWDALFLGALGAWALRQPRVRKWLCNRLSWIWLVVLISGLMVVVLLARSQGVASFGMTAGGHTVLAVLSLGLIFLALLSREGVVATVFRQPGLMWLGTVSYGVYLFHQPVHGLMHALFRNQAPRIAGWADAGVTLLALGCTVGLAVVSWRWFERPIVQLGQRVNYDG